MSGLTTAIIQYCVSPYVTRLTKKPDNTIEFETLSLFGKKIVTRVDPADLEKAQGRAFSTWKIRDNAPFEQMKETKGWFRPRKYFYIHGTEPEKVLAVENKQKSFDDLLKN